MSSAAIHICRAVAPNSGFFFLAAEIDCDLGVPTQRMLECAKNAINGECVPHPFSLCIVYHDHFKSTEAENRRQKVFIGLAVKKKNTLRVSTLRIECGKRR